jgi:hypothetical protein
MEQNAESDMEELQKIFYKWIKRRQKGKMREAEIFHRYYLCAMCAEEHTSSQVFDAPDPSYLV